MRCQEVVSVWDKSINSWISEVKQYRETVANEPIQNGRGEYQINKITYAKGGLLLMVESNKLWTLKPKLQTSQIWSLINNFDKPLRFLTVVWKTVSTELFLKMQFVKNVLVYVLGVFGVFLLFFMRFYP